MAKSRLLLPSITTSSVLVMTMRGQDMDARKEMLGLIRSRRYGYSLEQPFYIDPEFFRLDMELIWYRDWLFVGHDCELPKPGSFFTVQVGRYPVVLVRDRDGQIDRKSDVQVKGGAEGRDRSSIET